MLKLLLALGCSVSLLALASGGCDGSCEDGAFRCAGNALQRCQAGDFVTIEDCGETARCMAAFGSCEPTTASGPASSSATGGGGGAGASGGAGGAAGGASGSGGAG